MIFWRKFILWICFERRIVYEEITVNDVLCIIICFIIIVIMRLSILYNYNENLSFAHWKIKKAFTKTTGLRLHIVYLIYMNKLLYWSVVFKSRISFCKGDKFDIRTVSLWDILLKVVKVYFCFSFVGHSSFGWK